MKTLSRILAAGGLSVLLTLTAFPALALDIGWLSNSGPPEVRVNYSVYARGDGEAVVAAKLEITNDTNQTLDKYAFGIKNVVFQDGPYFVQEVINGQDSGHTTFYSFFYHPNEERSYTKLAYNRNGDQFLITLERPIPPGGNGSVIVHYRTFSYATRSFLGRRNLDFRTFDIAQEVNLIHVTVTVDHGLFTAKGGGTGGIQYQFNREFLGTAAADLGLAASNPPSPEQNRKLSNLSDAIDIGTESTRAAAMVAAHDTYRYRIAYATTFVGLYWSQIAIAVLMTAAIIAAAAWLRRRRRPARAAASKPEQAAGLVSGAVPAAAPPRPLPALAGRRFSPTFACFIVGLLNAAAVICFCLVAPYLIPFVTELDYPFLKLIGALTGFAVLIAISIGPSLYVGYRHGRRYGLFTAGFLVLWLLAATTFFVVRDVDLTKPGCTCDMRGLLTRYFDSRADPPYMDLEPVHEQRQ